MGRSRALWFVAGAASMLAALHSITQRLAPTGLLCGGHKWEPVGMSDDGEMMFECARCPASAVTVSDEVG